jgi:hypothetical protein
MYSFSVAVDLGGISKRNTTLSNINGYYPVNNLFRTSKAFTWMCKYEFIDVYSDDIRIRDIHGSLQNMVSMYNSKLSSYKIGDNSNIYRSGRRTINGGEYREDWNMRFSERINCDCEFYTCEQLNAIQAQIFSADPLIGDICEYSHIDSRMVMRAIIARLNSLDIEFNASEMIPVADNPYY